MSAIPYKQFIAEITDSFNKAIMEDIEAIRHSSEPEQAWRRCVKAGVPPVYDARFPGLMSDTIGFIVPVTPPEGWKP